MKKLLLFVVMLVSVLSGAQTSFYTDQATGISPFGSLVGLTPIPYGQVRVCLGTDPTSGTCAHPASIFDSNGNPISIIGGNFGQIRTDVTGRFTFGCSAGNYNIQVAASSSNTPQLGYKTSCPSTSGGGGGGSTSGAGAGVVNVMTDCTGIVGDNVTDDGPAIQACINANAGRHLVFPKRAAYITDGGTATNCDYFSGQQLVMKGNNQVIDGALVSNWAGGTCIRFASGIGGISVPFDAYSVLIENLELRGGDCADGTLPTFEDWRGTEALLRGPGPDGISIAGSVPRLQNLNIGCFKRHGVYISGDNTIHANSFPDFWRIDRLLVNANRASGLFINGADSNAGVGTMIDARSNQLYGVEDNASLGNTFIGVGTHNNHHDAILVGVTQALTSCSVTANVMTCTTAGALANGINTNNTWVTTAGQVDGTFNTTFRVTSFNAGAQTVTGTFIHANGATTGGTIGTASSQQVYNVWSAAGIFGGCIGGSDGGTWIQPYMESSQGIGGFCMAFGSTAPFIIGGNDTVLDMGTTAAGALPTQMVGSSFYRNGFTFANAQDTTVALSLMGGKTVRQNMDINFVNYNGVVLHQIFVSNGGFFAINDAADGFAWLVKQDGGNILLRGGSATEDIHVNELIGRDAIFYCGTGSACGTFSNADSKLHLPTQLIESVATGTAPFSVTSTTPVANLTTVPATYNHGGTQQTGAHLVVDSCTLGTDCAVTLVGAAVFTSSTSYTCAAEDQTAAAATKIVQSSGSVFTITGTGTDSIRYHCSGN